MEQEIKAPHQPVRSSWREAKLIVGKPLNDKKIEEYRAKGWYSGEFRQARRELWEKKAAKRKGNFLETAGRLIYSPHNVQ